MTFKSKANMKLDGAQKKLYLLKPQGKQRCL